MADHQRNRVVRWQRRDAVMEQCRAQVLGFCDLRLRQLLEQAGSALLEFAERAESDTVQSRFLDAVGQLARRREDIEHLFRVELNAGFDQLGSAHPGHPAGTDSGALEGDQLALVEPDEMEERIASENLVLRANANHFPDLYALSQRLAFLHGGGRLKDSDIPGGPHHLVTAFRRSLDGLDVEVRVRVILYALFDRCVLRDAGPLYVGYNALLMDAGVLPDLRPIVVQPEPGRRPPAPQSDAGGASPGRASLQGARDIPGHIRGDIRGDAGGDATGAGGHPGAPGGDSLAGELFESILDLMSARRPDRGPTRGAGEGRAQDPGAQTRQLLAAISSLQTRGTPDGVHTSVAEAAEFPDEAIDGGFIRRIQDALGRERQQVLSQIDPEHLSPVDGDLIDLIGMLFEYMLNDPFLPNMVKALLSRLHTPYLKVALIDRRLLVDASHPARRLLDAMVEAGSLWVEDGNPSRGVYPAMQRLVQRVMRDFADDIGLFDALLGEFEGEVAAHQRRSETTELRNQEAARGREKLLLAKQRAAHAVRALLARHPLPRAVAEFLSGFWHDHLVFVLLRDEEQEHGSSWKGADALANRLVTLFARLAPGATASPDPGELAELRRQIATVVQRMGSRNNPTAVALFRLLDDPRTWHSPSLERIGGPAPGGPGWETGAAAGPAVEPPASAAEEERLEQVRRLRAGTWVELESGPGGGTRHVKLSWTSPDTGTCMFVDRAGVQARTLSLRELARELDAGRVRILSRPKHAFIDRALTSIRRMLQGDGAEAGPGGGIG